jgi:hypothetical protein
VHEPGAPATTDPRDAQAPGETARTETLAELGHGENATADLARTLDLDTPNILEPRRALPQSFVHVVRKPADARRAVLDWSFIASGIR